jgi:hypothetical protein
VKQDLDHVATPPLYVGVVECAGPSPYGRCGSWDVSGVIDGSGEGWLMIPTADQGTDAAGLRNIRLSADDAILDLDLWWTLFDPRESIHFYGTRTASP